MTLAAGVAIGLMAVAATASAYAAYSSTQAQKSAARYNQDVEEQNARIAELQAQDTEARGRMEEDAYRLRLGQMKGQQLSALASTGVQLGTGSALNLQQDLLRAGDLDALTIRMNTEREAYATRLSGMSALAQSRLSGLQASYARPGQAAAVSLAGSAGQFASTWYAGRGRTATTDDV